MLKRLALKNVGPAESMELDFGQRINVLTGDNGLGKSFLLDVAWWAMTTFWPSRFQAFPADSAKDATISVKLGSDSESVSFESEFHKQNRSWAANEHATSGNKLAVYLKIDGGFGVWDAARTSYELDPVVTQTKILGVADPFAFHFSEDEVWNGQVDADLNQVLCNGLVRDLINWQLQNGPAWQQFCSVLKCLSPLGEELLPGKPTRLALRDVRDIPTMRTAYGREVALPLLSAGMKRIIELSYVLVWLWQEHQIACKLLGREPAEQPLFDEAKDRLFHIQQEGTQVRVDNVPWAKQGDVANWLVSDVFGLKQARSRESEVAIEAAEAWMRGDRNSLPLDLDDQDKIHAALVRSLPGHDHFWPRWIVSTKQVPGARP